MFRIKKIFIFILAVSLLFPFELSKTEAASTTLSKTVEYFVGQESAVRNSGQYANFSSFTVSIPENIDATSVKSAIIEINGVSYNDSGNQTITIDLEKNNDAAGTVPAYAIDHTLSVTNKPKSFKLQYDALNDAVKSGVGPMSDIIASGVVYTYTLYIKDTVSAGSVSFSVASAKLILTYNYPASSSNLLKTTKFFIEQKINQVASGNEINRPFTISIPETSSPENTPLIRSVFVEIGGSAKVNVAGTGTIEARVAKAGFDPGYSSYSLDLGSSSCGSCVTPFLVRYDASSAVGDSDFPGSKDYTFYFKGTGFDTSLLSAKIIITYKYSESAAGLPVSGYAISSTVDTWDGVRAEGAAFNSLMWKGNTNGGRVRLQIATSNDSTGLLSDSDFKGPDCSSGTYYEPASGIPVEIMCPNPHNNKRYFRYKVILCSNDCISAGSNNPEVTDVIVNWAP